MLLVIQKIGLIRKNKVKVKLNKKKIKSKKKKQKQKPVSGKNIILIEPLILLVHYTIVSCHPINSRGKNRVIWGQIIVNFYWQFNLK